MKPLYERGDILLLEMTPSGVEPVVVLYVEKENTYTYKLGFANDKIPTGFFDIRFIDSHSSRCSRGDLLKYFGLGLKKHLTFISVDPGDDPEYDPTGIFMSPTPGSGMFVIKDHVLVKSK